MKPNRNPEECPCRYCTPPKRTTTCHSSCPDYKQWLVIDANKKEKIRAAKKAENEVSSGSWFASKRAWRRGSNL